MCLAAIALPLGTVISLGGLGPVVELIDLGSQRGGDTDAATLSAIGFVIGSLAISLGTFGQPHLMVRFMALKDHRARHTAARITLIWYLVVFSGMVLTGLVGRGIFDSLDNNEQVFFALSEQVLPPVLAGLLLAAVLSAIMSTADSQLLVCASTLSHDLTDEALKGSPQGFASWPMGGSHRRGTCGVGGALSASSHLLSSLVRMERIGGGARAHFVRAFTGLADSARLSGDGDLDGVWSHCSAVTIAQCTGRHTRTSATLHSP
jgi:hypothetical protein